MAAGATVAVAMAMVAVVVLVVVVVFVVSLQVRNKYYEGLGCCAGMPAVGSSCVEQHGCVKESW